MRDVEPAAFLFPPQDREWGLPTEIPLTPRAARRLGREAAANSFDKAAEALSEDWSIGWDGKQIQRWSEALGRRLVLERDGEVAAYARGIRPDSPRNAPALLVVGMDGGRVQMREKDAASGSRWREDKVAAITSYLPGDGSSEHPPQALVTTHVGTMEKAEAFGKLVQVEAERRGLRTAETVLVLGDGGTWIDPLARRERLCDQRIVDYHHAAEHLYEAARAALGRDAPPAKTLGEQLSEWLHDGPFDRVLETLRMHARQAGPAQADDGREHPRRVLANVVEYFEKHRAHMDYPTYRKKGWPIGSGVTESGVKQFNKRVKGTEQFWTPSGVEAILALRALWLSQDDRWDRYWQTRPAYLVAA